MIPAGAPFFYFCRRINEEILGDRIVGQQAPDLSHLLASSFSGAERPVLNDKEIYIGSAACRAPRVRAKENYLLRVQFPNDNSDHFLQERLQGQRHYTILFTIIVDILLKFGKKNCGKIR
jgi:hypothetical protein